MLTLWFESHISINSHVLLFKNKHAILALRLAPPRDVVIISDVTMTSDVTVMRATLTLARAVVVEADVFAGATGDEDQVRLTVVGLSVRATHGPCVAAHVTATLTAALRLALRHHAQLAARTHARLADRCQRDVQWRELVSTSGHHYISSTFLRALTLWFAF